MNKSLFSTLDLSRHTLDVTNCPTHQSISEMVQAYQEGDSEESFRSPGSEDLFFESEKEAELARKEAAVAQLRLRRKAVLEKKGEEIKTRHKEDVRKVNSKIEKIKKSIENAKEEGRRLEGRRETFIAERLVPMEYTVLYEPLLKALSKGDFGPECLNATSNINATNINNNISTASTHPMEFKSFKS